MTNRIVTPADRFVGIYGDYSARLSGFSLFANPAIAISGQSDLAFTATADVQGKGSLVGSTSIAFTATAAGTRKARRTGTISITFSSNADGRILGGESISGSTTISISATASPRFGGAAVISFGASGALTRRSGDWTDQVDSGGVWTEQSDNATSWTVAA